MTFVPGRRRKKHAFASRSILDVNASDDLEWIDESKEDNIRQIRTRGHRSISINEGDRKRKYTETVDNYESKLSKDEIYIASVTLLHLREIGACEQNNYRRSSKQRNLCVVSNRKSWMSLLLRKPSPGPSINDNGNDSSVEIASSQWVDHSPPIYNSQYFNNSMNNSSVSLNKKVWRKRQTIPFSKLKTPMMDAILAIDRAGSYLIGIGGERSAKEEATCINGSSAKLLLKFYGEMNMFERDS